MQHRKKKVCNVRKNILTQQENISKDSFSLAIPLFTTVFKNNGFVSLEIVCSFKIIFTNIFSKTVKCICAYTNDFGILCKICIQISIKNQPSLVTPNDIFQKNLKETYKASSKKRKWEKKVPLKAFSQRLPSSVNVAFWIQSSSFFLVQFTTQIIFNW